MCGHNGIFIAAGPQKPRQSARAPVWAVREIRKGVRAGMENIEAASKWFSWLTKRRASGVGIFLIMTELFDRYKIA
ncbi:hypothetical protein EGT74_00180 [Chitinophaga lutea]|uniref:Uncharacterized protein n=1 Tax=Chitinophaga lutea TaxID=2488634 RepID=A0A3N4PYP6_9BACT|nr:hypothetical protein EGT74_00180 [Chitinophaga lutea]